MSVTLIRRNMDPNSLAGATNLNTPNRTGMDPNELFFAMNKDYFSDKSFGFISNFYGNQLWEFKVSEAYWLEDLVGVAEGKNYIKITSDEQLRDVIAAHIKKTGAGNGIYGAILRFKLSDVDQTSIRHTTIKRVNYLPFVNRRFKNVPFDQLLNHKLELQKVTLNDEKLKDFITHFDSKDASEFLKDNPDALKAGRKKLRNIKLRNNFLLGGVGYLTYRAISNDPIDEVINNEVKKHEKFFDDVSQKVKSIPDPKFKTVSLAQSIAELKNSLSTEKIIPLIIQKIKTEDITINVIISAYIDALHESFDSILSAASSEPEQVIYNIAFANYMNELNKNFINIFEICKNELVAIGIDLKDVPQIKSSIQKYNSLIQKSDEKKIDFFSYIRQNKNVMIYIGGILGVTGIAYLIYKYRNKIKEKIKDMWGKIKE